MKAEFDKMILVGSVFEKSEGMHLELQSSVLQCF